MMRTEDTRRQFRVTRAVTLAARAGRCGDDLDGRGGPAPDGAGTVTFTKQVAPIFQKSCQTCHHAGTAAPMALTTYQEVRPWARSIKARVTAREMPPWHLDKTVGIRKYKNDISLNDDEIATIVKWVDGGAAAGQPGGHAAAAARSRPKTPGTSASRI